MAKLLTALSAFALLYAVASAQCGSTCRFRLCQSIGPLGKVGRMLQLRAPKTPAQGPVICLPDSDLGFVRKTGEAVLELGGGDVKISKWKPSGLSPKFKKTFFKAGKIKPLGRSSPIRRATKGNQWSFLDDLCVKLPILKYEVKTPTFKIVDTAGDPEDCVAFTAFAPLLFIEATWQSRDDLDLVIIDPLGRELSRKNKIAGDGRFGIDNAAGVCQTKQEAVGKERGRWPKGGVVPKGDYQITLRHFNNCNAGKTKWQIRITVNGVLVLFRKGKSNLDGNRVITTFTYTV